MVFLKIKAGALQLTLFIAVVVALLLFAFILYVQTQKQFSLQTDHVIEMINLADTGIEYGLSNTIQLNDTVTVDLNQEDYKTLKVHKSYWGIFEKITSLASIKSHTFKKAALTGGKQDKNTIRVCLYLEDNNRPLLVVGNTHIEGTTHLPKQGVKPGNIAGHSYYGSQLIYGSIKYSSNYPTLSKEHFNYLKNISKTSTNSLDIIEFDNDTAIKNSFLASQKILFNNATIVLSNTTLTGNIIVQSKTKIVVENSAVLNDVLLIAPSIEIKDKVKGKFQAIATKVITVGKQVELDYPSALVLMKEFSEDSTNKKIDSIFEDSSIHIESDSSIKGVVVFHDASETTNFNSQIIIDKNTVVHGEVYCNRNLELKGSVYGSVYTTNFLTRESGSVYQNHLYNAEINIEKLSEFYVGLPLSINQKSVAKWLY